MEMLLAKWQQVRTIIFHVIHYLYVIDDEKDTGNAKLRANF